MAELIPGFIAGEVPAHAHRMIHAATFLRSGASGVSGQVQARSGVLGYKSLKVSVSSALTLTVASGLVLLQGSNVTQGAYILVNDSDDTVTLTTANGSLARKDAVIARVYDTTDGVGGNGNQWVIDRVTGTPSASPVLATLPLDAVLLAEVTVPAGATSLTGGNIIDRRVFTVATGGVLPCTSATLPTDPAPGQMVWLTDVSGLDLWTGSAYTRLYQPRTWNDLTLTSAYATFGNGYANLGYSIYDNVVSLRGVIRSTVSTSAAATITTLPAGMRPSYRFGVQIPGPSGNPLIRVDILTSGIISDLVAHGPQTSMIFDNIHIPLG